MTRATTPIPPTSASTPPSTTPYVKNVDKFTVWVDVLDPDTAQRQGGLQRITDFVKKRGGNTLMSDNDLGNERKQRAGEAIKAQETKRDLIPGLDSNRDLKTLFDKADIYVTKLDLAIPDENQKMLKQIRKIEMKISAEANSVRPGANVLLSEIVSLEKSVDFQVADQLAGGHFTDPRLKVIKDEASGTIANIPIGKTIEKLRLLKNDCVRIVREFEQFDKTNKQFLTQITDKRNAIDTVSNRVVEAGTLSSPALAHFQVLLCQARTVLDEAEELQPARPTLPTDVNSWAKTITDHHTAVTNKLAAAQGVIDEATTFETTYNAAQSPDDKQKVERLATIKQDINDYYDAAVIAGFARDDATRDRHLQSTTAASNDEIRVARSFADALISTLDEKEKEWAELKNRNNSAIRFGIQLLGETQALEQEELQGMDTRDKLVKQRHGSVKLLFHEYETAIGHAKQRNYQEAINCFKKALDGPDSTTPGLVALRDQAQTAYAGAKVLDTDLKERTSAFNASLGDFTTKSKIRFSDEAYEMMLGIGLSIDEDGDAAYSDQFQKLQEQFKIALKMWHKLREKGVDPFKAADRAFEGIPENFWPPEAVRAIAMFRLAEAEFEEERQVQELEEKLRGGRVSRAAEKVINAVDSVLDSKVGDKAGRAKDHVLDKGSAAIDIGSGITSSLGKLKDAKIAEYEQQFKDQHPNFSKDEMKSALEDKKDAFEEKAFDALNMSKDHFARAEEAFKILGTIGTAVSVLDGIYNVAKDGKDIAKAQLAIQHYDPETDSPVELKLRQFERMRAIWHLVDHLADTILSGLGFVPDGVPVVGDVASCLGDLKGLVIEAVQAAEYFKRLNDVRSQKNQAKYDRETMMELALANEAYKLGLLGSKKTFEAVTQLVKFVGSLAKGVGEFTAEVDFGATFISGFAVNKSGLALQYAGKLIFYVKVKIDDRSAKKALFAAKADPDNINAVEPVFEKCTMYARFALAYGATHGDRWARNYILSRGVTDSDLDNPNTSTAILREYLNVTFQSKQFGEAEKDKDYGAANEAKRDEGSQFPDQGGLTEAPGFVGLWSPSDLNLDSTSFKSNYDAALKDGLQANKKAVKAISNWFDVFATEREKVGPDPSTAADKALAVCEDAYRAFEQALSSTAPELQARKKTAMSKLGEFVEAASRFAVACERLQGALTAFQPLAKTKSPQLHEAMRIYLHELGLAVDREYEPVRIYRDKLPKKKLSLDLELDPADANFVKDAQEKVTKDFEDQAKELTEVSEEIERQIEVEWKLLQLSTNIGKGTRETLETVAASIIDPAHPNTAKTDLVKQIDGKFTAIRKQITQGAIFAARKIVIDASNAMREAEAIQDTTKKTKQVAKIKAQRHKRIRDEAVAYWLDQAAKLLREEFNDAVDAVMKNRNTAASKKFDPDRVVSQLGTPTPFALSRAYWQACKDTLALLGWKNSKTGIGQLLDDFGKAKHEWTHLKGDDILQANWRAAHGKLLNKIHTIPTKTDKGVAVPGIDDLKKKLLEELEGERDTFEKGIAGEEDVVTGSDGWVPNKAQLDRWPLTQEGWILMHDLARKHGWEAHNSLKNIGRLFKKYAEAKEAFDTNTSDSKKKQAAKKACEALINRLEKWDPNTKAKRRKPDHKGIMACQERTKQRLRGILQSELT